MIRLIIFDFDGTLGDTRRNIVTTMQVTIRELGLPGRTDEECASKIGLPLDGCFEALYPDERRETNRLCCQRDAGCRRYERRYPDGGKRRRKDLRCDLWERNKG